MRCSICRLAGLALFLLPGGPAFPATLVTPDLPAVPATPVALAVPAVPAAPVAPVVPAAPVAPVVPAVPAAPVAAIPQADTLVFTPQWSPQSQFAGYYVALEKGFYKEAGLNVKIVNSSTSNPALNKLKEKKSHFITMQLPQALVEIDRGTELVNILQTSQHSSLMLVCRKPLTDFRELNGKKVGRWKVGFSHLAEAFERDHGLDIEWIPFIQNINLYISGAIDATLVTSFNEYFQLKASGVPLDGRHVIRFSAIGYDVPEDGLYVTAGFYREHRDEAVRFREASRKGWAWAAEHPDEALDIVMKYVSRQGNSTNRVLQRWMLGEILELQLAEGGTRTFTLTREAFAKACSLLSESGLLGSPVPYDDFTGNR